MPSGIKGTYIEHICKICKKPFKNHNTATKYCSRKCFYKAETKDTGDTKNFIINN